MDTPVVEKIVEHLAALPDDLQWRVLEFTLSLANPTPRGVPGQRLLAYAGGITPEDVRAMSEAIEHGCEQVDPNDW